MNNISENDLKLLKEKYQGENLDIALNKIKEGYPVQYLIGYVNFCGNHINVNEHVLIPRFETEFLVDLIKRTINSSFAGDIIDIGTGSGCIAISLSKIFKNAQITGLDVSKDALDVANENKNINKATNITFIREDIFKFDELDKYNVIVSNPPYVSHNEPVGLETKYEPQNAIFADNDGLIFYEEILKKLSKNNSLMTDVFFEIGMNQKEQIIKMSKNYLPNCSVKVYKDLANKDRYVHIYMNK